eukprot:EG_transcript_5459
MADRRRRHTAGWLGWGRGWFRKTKPSPADVHLRRALHDALLHTHFTELDPQSTGTLTLANFQQLFETVATKAELEDVFQRIRKHDTGDVTYRQYVTFQEAVSGQCLRRAGDPKYLEYASLLEGVVLSCSREDFTARLDQTGERFPPSTQWLLQEMKQEWSDNLLQPHWQYVANPVPHKEEERRFPNWWKGGFSVLDETHAGMTLQDFCQSPEAQFAGLTEPEVLGLRLYTGPGYRRINCSLRANSGRFSVTQFCIDCAIGKLAQKSTPCSTPLMRGLGKPMPARWVRMYEWYGGVRHRRLALSDPGFVSTTTDPKVAMGADFGGPVLFLLHTATMIDHDANRHYAYLSHGADVRWVSQFSSEAEVLLPSNTVLVPQLRCRHWKPPDLTVCENVVTDKTDANAQQGADKDPPAVYEFRAFYPWDSTLQCPLVYNNQVYSLLRCANDLLDVVYGLELQLWQECRQGHPEQPAMFTSLARPPQEEGDAASLPTTAFPIVTRTTKYESDTLFPLSDTCPPAEHEDLCSCCSTVELISPHSKHLYLLDLSLDRSFLPGSSLSPELEEDAGDLEAPHPRAVPHASSTSPVSRTLPSNPPDPLDSSRRAAWPSFHRLPSSYHNPSQSPPETLRGTNALCHSRLPYYTEADVRAALAKLKARQRGSDAPTVAGGEYPLQPVVASPFATSAWKLSL